MNTHFSIAIHALTVLAMENQQAPLSAKHIAGSVNTHPVFLRRVLNALQEAGLVESRRGPSGGICLNRSPDKITLLDVYKAVSGSKSHIEIHDAPNPTCKVGKYISHSLEFHFSRAEEAMQDYLRGVTIAELLEEVLARS